MFLNKSVPEILSASVRDDDPDYSALVRFLIEPFLESPDSLSVDCEKSNGKERVWIRLAFNGEDKGRVFGRGGRNIQAIRTVIKAAAQAAGQTVYLDIYEGSGSGSSPRRDNGPSRRTIVRRNLPRRVSRPRVTPRFRS
ncbi:MULTISPECIES: KH domain-containing protein [unclassified Moorena]|uniref:KH domain-containing protein n=1 Tax=Moorena TaxID=1155738 RepID=UPI0013BCF20E|nr:MULTISPECIES: KH domain-containing protein [unclassified Moorena]NEO70105.1 KH domain-containing protein [Moorena sp. SIO3H5]NEO81103.1 KH domain-containing protein [Moorena sp. SIO4G3]